MYRESCFDSEPRTSRRPGGRPLLGGADESTRAEAVTRPHSAFSSTWTSTETSSPASAQRHQLKRSTLDPPSGTSSRTGPRSFTMSCSNMLLFRFGERVMAKMSLFVSRASPREHARFFARVRAIFSDGVKKGNVMAVSASRLYCIIT